VTEAQLTLKDNRQLKVPPLSNDQEMGEYADYRQVYLAPSDHAKVNFYQIVFKFLPGVRYYSLVILK
jgi:hypothetical protein